MRSLLKSSISLFFVSSLLVIMAELGKAQSITPAIDGTETTVTQSGDQYDITGGTVSGDGANLFHSFQQFGLSAGEVANFLADPTIQNILGRINGGDASIINGLIQVSGGNANLFLINPAGILFGPEAALNVPAAFTAATATGIGFDNSWFSAFGGNDYASLVGSPDTFAFTTLESGVILNAGDLAVNPGQQLILLGGSVINTGSLSAPGGEVTIAAIPSENLVRISHDGMVLNLELETLEQSSSSPLPPPPAFTPLDLPTLLTDNAVGHATGVTVNPNGSISLTGSGLEISANPGLTLISGTIDTANFAAVVSPSSPGGSINILGDYIALINANVNASGVHGGGTVQIGGGYQGLGTVPNASRTFVDSDSVIQADALEAGDGGQVIIWADEITQFLGEISARGGLETGNGGFVEVSGLQSLDFHGQVDTSAFHGNVGTLLLDPTNITVVGSAGNTADTTLLFGDSPDNASIEASAINNAIANVILQATNDITFDAPVSLDNFGVGLTAEAGNTITVNQSIQSSAGDITLIANGNVGGADAIVISDLITTEGGDITLSSPNGSITTADLDTSAEGGSGSITLNAGGGITTANLFSSGVFGNAGAITLEAGGGIQTQYIDSKLVIGSEASGGDVTLIAGGDITTEAINTEVDTGIDSGASGNGGAVMLQAGGVISTGDINTAADLTGGTVDIQAGAAVNLGEIITRSLFLNGGDVFLDASGDIQVAFIDAQGGNIGLGGLGGAVNIVTEQFFRAIGSFMDQNGDLASLSTAADSGGDITITHGGGQNGIPLEVGDAAANGTAAAITSGNFTISPTQSFIANFNLGGTDPGNIDLITSDPVPDPVPDPDPDPVPDPTPDPDPVPDPTPDPDLDLDPCHLVCGPPDSIEPPPPEGTPDDVEPPLDDLTDEAESPPEDTPEDPPEEGENPRDLRQSAGIEPEDLTVEEAFQDIEDIFTDEFADHLGLENISAATGLDSAQGALQRIRAQTNVRTALVYVVFGPGNLDEARNLKQIRQDDDPLELVLVTSESDPVYVRMPEATRRRVIKQVQRLRRQVANPNRVDTASYLASAQRLYQWLIAPLEAELESQGIENLAFVMDSTLRATPIAALHDGERFLIEKYSLGLIPSLSLIDMTYIDLRNTQVLVGGATEFLDQDPLPAVSIEIDAIAGLWPGQQLQNEHFTVSNLQAQRQQSPYGIIHLATHGEFLPGDLGNSYIQFADGRLRLDQLRQLGWNDPPVELVVLSACQTALGNREAELGFAGFSVLAGAKSALASLWNVNDEATAGLMAEFYRQLQATPIKAEALRQAQLAMINGQVSIDGSQLRWQTGQAQLPPILARQGHQELSHPFFWAAFTLVGSPW